METYNQLNQNLMADDIKEKCLKTKTANKTADINAYMNAYMKQKYNADPLKAKLYKNTRNYKKKYALGENLIDKYGIFICHICRMREIIDELPEEMFAKFLAEYKTIELKPRDC